MKHAPWLRLLLTLAAVLCWIAAVVTLMGASKVLMILGGAAIGIASGLWSVLRPR